MDIPTITNFVTANPAMSIVLVVVIVATVAAICK